MGQTYEMVFNLTNKDIYFLQILRPLIDEEGGRVYPAPTLYLFKILSLDNFFIDLFFNIFS